MFQSTQTHGSAELMRVSAFQREHATRRAATDADAGHTRLAALNPSLLQDLMRFDQGQRPGGLDVLEVLAAALRHNRTLLLHLQLDGRVMPLKVLPASRQVCSPVPAPHFLALRLPGLQVLRVEPAPSTDTDDPPWLPQALGPVLWELALRGARSALLPEIAGVATYRVTPSADLDGLGLNTSLAAAVQRLRQRTTPLREFAGWPGIGRDRAMRALNGLYLQSALIVTRSYPGAVSGL